MSESLGDELNRLGWCNGAVVPHGAIDRLLPFLRHVGQNESVAINPDDWLILISQTCDIVARDLAREPYAELLHCAPTPKLRTQFKGLRSTRRLDFKPNAQQHPSVVLSAHAMGDRYIVPRDILRGISPDPHRQIGETASAKITAWYALRYSRPAWPDAFVRRIDGGRLEEILEPLADDIAEVRVSIVENGELTAGTPYHVVVSFVVDEQTWNEDLAARQSVFAVYDAFTTMLNSFHGIDVDMELSGVFSGGEFTWQEVQSSDLWNFANLSNQDES